MELILPKIEVRQFNYDHDFEDHVVAIHTHLVTQSPEHQVTTQASGISIEIPHVNGETILKTEATDVEFAKESTGFTYNLGKRSFVAFGADDMTFTIERHRIGNPKIVDDPFFNLILGYFTSHLEQTQQNQAISDKKLAIRN